jgi:hypothetical protein
LTVTGVSNLARCAFFTSLAARSRAGKRGLWAGQRTVERLGRY